MRALNPAQTLGVATFSVAQRQAVLKELELLRRANPDVEEFFSAASHEPFFVKNLENIQGDERDVIFISVGYGKTDTGYLAHAFGPLSGEGGERRLNVLISRAKLRCEVFCNFTGADIDLERSRARGVGFLPAEISLLERRAAMRGQLAAEFEVEKKALETKCKVALPVGYSPGGKLADALGKLVLRGNEPIETSETLGRLAIKRLLTQCAGVANTANLTTSSSLNFSKHALRTGFRKDRPG